MGNRREHMSGKKDSRFGARSWYLLIVLTMIAAIAVNSAGAFAGKLSDTSHGNNTAQTQARQNSAPAANHQSSPQRFMSPNNLAINGDFETGSLYPFTTTLTSGSGTINSDPAYVHAGTYSARVNSSTVNNSSAGVGGGGNCSPPGGVRIPVSPSTGYSWSGYVYVPVTATNFLNTRIRVAFYASPNCSGGSQITPTFDSNVITTTSGIWTQVTGIALSPATAAFAEVRLLASASTGGVATTVYFDDINFDVAPITATPTSTPTGAASSTPTNTPVPPGTLSGLLTDDTSGSPIKASMQLSATGTFSQSNPLAGGLYTMSLAP